MASWRAIAKAERKDVQPLRRLLAIAVVCAAMAYLIWATTADSNALADAIGGSDYWLWGASVIVFLPMFLAQARYHALALRGMDPDRRAFCASRDAAAFLQSQVVRYLPGKIWGLLYQVDRMKDRHPAARVLAANLWQMVSTNLLSLAIGASLILLGTGVAPGWVALLLVLSSVAVSEFLHRTRLFALALAWFSSRSVWFARLGLPSPPTGLSARGTILLLIEWLFFAAGLWLLMAERVEPAAAITAIGLYATSSTAAILAIAVPAGIAVREALFVSAHDVVGASGATLLVIATQARLSMVAAELLACGITTLVALRERDAKE
jgi:uncharacterized membrane protein YbhN (UPF0104 family)